VHPTFASSPHAPSTLITIGVVVGALTSPFLAVWTVLLGIPAAALAWWISEQRDSEPARLIAAALFGLVVGASLYFLLGLVVSVATR
jgi:hypothetical protein